MRSNADNAGKPCRGGDLVDRLRQVVHELIKVRRGVQDAAGTTRRGLAIQVGRGPAPRPRPTEDSPAAA